MGARVSSLGFFIRYKAAPGGETPHKDAAGRRGWHRSGRIVRHNKWLSYSEGIGLSESFYPLWGIGVLEGVT